MPQIAFYRAFGLVIASDQCITNLDRVEAQPHDVEISRVSAGHRFDRSGVQNTFANWQASPGCLSLRVEGVAEYHVRSGDRIEIKPEADASAEAISAYLMGSAFSALLQQRRMLTLHASAVMGPGGAILFVGRSGIGKSTTMTAMKAKGFDMVTDDVAAIEFGECGDALVRPSFSGARLSARSLQQLGRSELDYRRLDAEIEKFAFPTTLVEASETKIDCIFVLDVGADQEIAIREMSRAEAFQLLSFYTFRKRFYDGMGMESFHFDAVSRLAASIPVLSVVRPEHPFLLNRLISSIIERLISSAGETTSRKNAMDSRV